MAASDHLNPKLFHGTAHPFKEGELVTSAESRNVEVNEHRKDVMKDAGYVYATTDRNEAARFASVQAERAGAEPLIFEVEPTGDVEKSGVDFGQGDPGVHVRSRAPMRVVKPSEGDTRWKPRK